MSQLERATTSLSYDLSVCWADEGLSWCLGQPPCNEHYIYPDGELWNSANFPLQQNISHSD